MTPVDNERRPLRIIVSGGIGSGKSTVAAMLGELGAMVIDTDSIGHEILEPGGAAFAAVAARWPATVVEGHIDRSRLAAIVFSDQDQLAELEAISHPLIAGEIAARVVSDPNRDVVIELPVAADLAGPGWVKVVVDAPAGLRLRRAATRGMDAADAANRMNAQPDPDRVRGDADFVIENQGTRDELRARVAALWAQLTGSGAGEGRA